LRAWKVNLLLNRGEEIHPDRGRLAALDDNLSAPPDPPDKFVEDLRSRLRLDRDIKRTRLERLPDLATVRFFSPWRARISRVKRAIRLFPYTTTLSSGRIPAFMTARAAAIGSAYAAAWNETRSGTGKTAEAGTETNSA
jgi:hypothetical protein